MKQKTMKTKLFIMLIALLVFSVNNSVNAQVRKTHLGLPSGTKWASCNVGANKPEEYGDYYAWVDPTQYDVARAKWGGKWRMPTIDEVKELVQNCKYKWTTLNGVKGGKFTGPNGKSIFLPAAGRRWYGELSGVGTDGFCWSCTPSDVLDAYFLYFVSDGAGWFGNGDVLNDLSVRPVISNDNKNKQIKGRNTSSQSKTTQSQTQPKTTTSRAYTSCPDNNHPHIIDLGLPSGTKWACCNVDAKKPEDYGGYYAWGETSTKTEYSSSNYRYEKVNLGNDISGTQYDVAHVKWGGKWQMPTQEQIKELDDNCKYEWTTLNGVKGGKFTGPIGGSIFLPAAGWRLFDDLNDAGEIGNYWSSTQYPDNSNDAYDLDFYSGLAYWDYGSRRYRGQGVRPLVRN